MSRARQVQRIRKAVATAVVAVAAGAAAGCGTSRAEAAASDAASAAWAAPAPVTASAPRMGHLTLAQADGGTTTVFYPTTAAETAIVQGPFHLSWAEAAPPLATHGRLVVISHGSGGSPWVHTDLARALVRQGFMVALPQHAGDSVQDPSHPGPDSWRRRPQEVSATIDRLAADGRLAPLLRLDAVGVFGGSAGGHTALTLAGGRWSAARFRDHCLTHLREDFSSCVGFTTRLRGDALDGLKQWAARLIIRLRFSDGTPQAHHDGRVRAAVAMVPFAADFDVDSLRDPPLPLGLVLADHDVNQVPVFHGEAVLAACQPRCELLARLQDAGHGAMLSPMPPLAEGSVAQALLSDPPGFDRARVLPALHEAVAGFFVRTLLVP